MKFAGGTARRQHGPALARRTRREAILRARARDLQADEPERKPAPAPETLVAVRSSGAGWTALTFWLAR